MTAAIVLAAGMSSRMEGGNKLLQDLHGKPVVAHVVETLSKCPLEEVIVVTGHEAGRVENALQGYRVRFVFNENFRTGQAGSVIEGIRRVHDGADAALICLGDMPLVKETTIKALLVAFESGASETILAPSLGGRRGNPVLWPRRYFDHLSRLTGDEGARQILSDLKEHIFQVEVNDDGIFADADTNEALQTIRQKPQT